jgi:SAM-dependent methyltransferase
MHVPDLAANVQRDAAGCWSTASTARVSYPAEGAGFCFDVEDRSFWFAHRNRAVVAAVRRFPPAIGPLLDVGGGNGCVSTALRGAGLQPVVVEPSPDGARNAVRRGLSPVINATLADAGFRPSCAGGVGLFDVLEHIQDEAEFLSLVRHCLKPDGRLYLTVPAYRWLWSEEDQQAGHFRRYSRGGIRSTLRRAGFSVEFATGLFWWLPPAVFAFRSLPYRFGRKPRVWRPSSAAHTLGGGVLRRCAMSLSVVELGAIDRGIELPFGGSWLAVARVRG